MNASRSTRVVTILPGSAFVCLTIAPSMRSTYLTLGSNLFATKRGPIKEILDFPSDLNYARAASCGTGQQQRAPANGAGCRKRRGALEGNFMTTQHPPGAHGFDETTDLVRSVTLSSARLWEEVLERLAAVEHAQAELARAVAQLQGALPSGPIPPSLSPPPAPTLGAPSPPQIGGTFPPPPPPGATLHAIDAIAGESPPPPPPPPPPPGFGVTVSAAPSDLSTEVPEPLFYVPPLMDAQDADSGGGLPPLSDSRPPPPVFLPPPPPRFSPEDPSGTGSIAPPPPPPGFAAEVHGAPAPPPGASPVDELLAGEFGTSAPGALPATRDFPAADLAGATAIDPPPAGFSPEDLSGAGAIGAPAPPPPPPPLALAT